MKRLLGVLVALGLVVAAAVILTQSHGSTPSGAVTTLHGLVGSEKAAFFADGDVQKALRAKGLEVKTQHAGSWQMADQVKNDSQKYDFAFPASSTAAKSIPGSLNSVLARPFHSALVVVASGATAQLMKDNSLATYDEKSKLWTFNTTEYLNDFKLGKAWEKLDHGGADQNRMRGKIFLYTTDPQSSSSAALYLATMSYLENGNQVVSDQAGVNRVSQTLKGLMDAQGAQLASSEQLFTNFAAQTTDPIWAYESDAAAAAQANKLPKDSVVLYPDISIESDHTVVELTPQAAALSSLLSNDPTLIKLEAKWGFRPFADANAFATAMGSKITGFPKNLDDLNSPRVPSPSTENLRKLATAAKGTSN